MSNDIATTDNSKLMHEVIVKGNLADLSVTDRTSYYVEVCKSVGLNPLTKPFEYIVLNEKLTLYAKRDATDQLRQIHGVSITISAREKMDGVYVVTAKAIDKTNRTDESTGAVALEKSDGTWEQSAGGKKYFKKNGKTIPLTGDDLANAYMKAETKAKRRVTLSICGLGMLDETEIETISSASIPTEQPIVEQGVYKPTDPLRPYKDDHVIPCLVNSDGTLDFDTFTAEMEVAIGKITESQMLSLLNRANAKTMRAMQKERPELFDLIGEEFRNKAQSLM